MSRIALTDPEDIERRLAFIMDELSAIGLDAYAVVRTAKPSGLTDSSARWTEGRFSAFIQQARDAVWVARCTVGLVPQKEADHAD